MEIHVEAPKKFIGHARAQFSATEMEIEDNKLKIALIIEENEIWFDFPISKDIMEFLYDKIDNPYNRIELFLHEKDRVGEIELFSGDIGSAVIERIVDFNKRRDQDVF